MSAARVEAQDAATEEPDDAAAEDSGAAPADDTTPDVSPEQAATSSSGASSSGPTSGTTVINIHERDRDRDRDDEEEEAPQQSYFDPHELEGESYHHVGVFARGIIAPQFIQNLFVQGGLTALNVGVGGFYNYRKDGLNIIAEVWWAGFYGTGPFAALNESLDAMEMVESELQVVFGSIALMWSITLTSWLAIEVGLGLGFGGVFGGLYRTEAYPEGSGWTACRGPDDPNDPANYCDAREGTEANAEGHYQRVDGTPNPYNFSGGVPPLWFWIDLPRVAIRIKPLRQIQIRVEGGFAAYAFHFGSSLAFGF
jgi:hypothetical protein